MKGDKSDTGLRSHRHPEPFDYSPLDHSPPPARAAAYIPPTQVPKESKYRTLDLKAVRLAPEIDPERMKTQRALRRVPVVGNASAHSSTWVSWCLAGAALGLGAWWGVQWWRERTTQLPERVVFALPRASSQTGTASQTMLPPGLGSSTHGSSLVPVGLHSGVLPQPNADVAVPP